MLHDIKLRQDASETSTNIDRHGKKDPHVIGQYECGSKNSVVEIRALKIKKIEDKHAVFPTNNFKQLLASVLQ